MNEVESAFIKQTATVYAKCFLKVTASSFPPALAVALGKEILIHQLKKVYKNDREEFKKFDDKFRDAVRLEKDDFKNLEDKIKNNLKLDKDSDIRKAGRDLEDSVKEHANKGRKSVKKHWKKLGFK